MRRFIVLAVVFAASPVFAQDVILRVNLSSLGLGTIFQVRPVELNGRPGAEYLLKVDNPFGTRWTVLYPDTPNGVCDAGQIEWSEVRDPLLDFDGDGKQEIMRFDPNTQEVAFVAFPTCTQ